MAFLLLINAIFVASLITEEIPSFGVPQISLKAACLTYNESGTLYIFGGHEKSNKIHDEVYLYDINASKWYESIPIKASIPTPRYNSGCFVFQRSLFIFGGNTNRGPLNDLWSYDTVDLSWAEVQISNSPSFRYLFSYCSGVHQGKFLFAIYGGYKDEGISSGFYM